MEERGRKGRGRGKVGEGRVGLYIDTGVRVVGSGRGHERQYARTVVCTDSKVEIKREDRWGQRAAPGKL